MGNFVKNLDLGKCVLPPLIFFVAPRHSAIPAFKCIMYENQKSQQFVQSTSDKNCCVPRTTSTRKTAKQSDGHFKHIIYKCTLSQCRSDNMIQL